MWDMACLHRPSREERCTIYGSCPTTPESPSHHLRRCPDLSAVPEVPAETLGGLRGSGTPPPRAMRVWHQQFPLMTCRPSMTRVAESLAGVVTGHFLLWERLS